MRVVIECAESMHQEAAAQSIREQVFCREWGLKLPCLSAYDPDKKRTLVARCGLTGEAVATLTAVETTGDEALHGRVGVRVEKGERAARYTQLAVLKPYRGLHLPDQLILRARQEFVLPRKIDVTWLLFDAEHANSSFLCKVLGYEASLRVFETEYGTSRLLMRREWSAEVETSNLQARAALATRGLNSGLSLSL